EDAVGGAPHHMQRQRLVKAAGPLERIGAPALVIDRHGVVGATHNIETARVGDRMFPETREITSGETFLPALGWCLLEPRTAHGWLIVQRQQRGEDGPEIRVTLDLADPTQLWVRVTGPNVSWQSKIRPLHAKILHRLASRPEGLTSDGLNTDLYGPAAK